MTSQPRKGAKATAAADKKTADKAKDVDDTSTPDESTPPVDEQHPKAEKAGGDVVAVAPGEVPAVDANYRPDQAEERLADAKDGNAELHHDESDSDQLPDADQLTGEDKPNASEEALEHPEIDSAGEQKNTGYAPLSATDTSVVGNAVQQQKSVGALARAQAPADQNLTAIAESPVSPPNGERVVTYTTPPRIAIPNVAGGVDAEGESGEVDPVGSGTARPANTVHAQPTPTNGVRAGLETVDSGIIPDATVAETDGTFMPGGAPNETYDGTEAPDGLYTGAELNAAPLQAPQERQNTGDGGSAGRPRVSDAGVAYAVNGKGDIYDEATGEAPDVDGLFVPLYEHGHVMVSTKRLVERTSAGAGVLLLPVGAQVTDVQAERIKARLRG